MAASGKFMCVQCKSTNDNENEKKIKCSGMCNTYVHYTCSKFKPTELKIFDIYHKNIKWLCDACAGAKTQEISVNLLHAKLVEMENKFEKLLDIVRQQSEKIEYQTKIIKNLQSKETHVAEQESTQGPKTRSKTSTIEVCSDTTAINASSKGLQNKSIEKQKQLNADKNITRLDDLQKFGKEKKTQKEGESLQEKTDPFETNKIKTIRGNRINTTIEAAENRKWVFVSQLVKTTKEEDVKKYLNENGINVFSCFKLIIQSTDIAAFKIAVSEQIYDKLFNPELWPMNTIVRPYRHRNFRKSQPVALNT